MRVLGAIKPPEPAVLPVAIPVPGSTPPAYNERKFVLREHTPEGLCDYEASKAAARESALIQFATVDAADRTPETMLRLWMEMLEPVLAAILSEPADGGLPATPDEVRAIVMSRRTEILEAQEELSGLSECLGNAESLFKPMIDLLKAEAVAEQAEP